MNYSESLDYLFGLQRLGARLGTDVVTELLARMGDPQGSFPSVLVAGTNGKGSTAAFLDSVLRCAGLRTGLYTSPHLVRFEERIAVDGGTIPPEEVARIATLLREQADGMVGRGGEARRPSFFETATAMALRHFQDRRVDMAVLEVGLGGRLDATSVVDAVTCLFTPIDLDHQEWLGPDRDSIGREKAGIFRSGRAAVFGGDDPPAGLVEHADRLGARLLLAGRDFKVRLRDGDWDWEGLGRQRLGLPLPALRGTFQVRNAAAAIATLEAVSDRLSLSTVALREGLLGVRLPGRFEVFPGPITLIFDVAHNPEAARGLAENLARHAAEGGRTLAVFSMLRDKDIAGVARVLAPQISEWFYAPLEAQRAATGEQLGAALDAAGLGAVAHGHADLLAALAAAGAAARHGDRILVFGSFYTVSLLLPLARAAAGAPAGR